MSNKLLVILMLLAFLLGVSVSYVWHRSPPDEDRIPNFGQGWAKDHLSFYTDDPSDNIVVIVDGLSELGTTSVDGDWSLPGGHIELTLENYGPLLVPFQRGMLTISTGDRSMIMLPLRQGPEGAYRPSTMRNRDQHYLTGIFSVVESPEVLEVLLEHAGYNTDEIVPRVRETSEAK